MKNTIDLDDRLLQFQQMADDWDGNRSTLFIEAEELLADVALETLLLLIKSGRIIGCDERWQHGALGDMRAMIRDEFQTKTGEADRLVAIEEAAKILSLSVDYLYHNRKRLPFAVKIGRKLVKFSVNKMARWDGKLLPSKPKGR